MQQKTMFDIEEPPAKPEPVDPHVRDEDKPRLSKQCELVADLLNKCGSISRNEGEAYGIKRLAARIKDLKEYGMNISGKHVGKDYRYTLED